ncbi:MAG: hypothetical protein RMJ98_17470 [Myxococcales bacterium]|nr:hypothetical protein [Polyangiaceae bacterium]MDW8251086.1 hypothetical protein [Myxococcales bacterium]
MRIRSLALYIPILLLLNACNGTRTPSQQPCPTKVAIAPEPVHHNPSPPVIVKVRGPDKVSPGERFSLEVDIEVKPTSEPLSLRVRLPAGVTLVDGVTEETLAASPRILRTLQLQIGEIPKEDLHVEVVQRGPNWGARATASYRFGRPEPTLPQADALGVRRPGIPGAAIPITPR